MAGISKQNTKLTQEERDNRTMARKAKVYSVDFNALERKGAGNYRKLNMFEKEIIDRMVSLSNPAASVLSPHQMAALDLVYVAMEELTPRQREVLQLSFGLGDDGPLTEHQIAEQLKISQQGVHDLKMRAIKAIQKRVSLNSAVTKSIKKDEK